MKRYLEPIITEDLANKIVLLTGPRQSGKTTTSKQLGLSYDYFNMDDNNHYEKIINKHWDRKKQLLILAEFHKFKNWKRFIKGVYDVDGLNPKILITGSAKLDTFKNVGDSLAGRYFQFRLYPIDMHEACTQLNLSPKQAFDTLIHCSGFPEPFLKGEKNYYTRWQKSHAEIIIQQDLIDLTAVKSIKSIGLLATLLRGRVGSGINHANLAADLQVNAVSIKNWAQLLENVYMLFKITPYHNNIARSLLKEPKVYFYDIAAIKEESAQLENLVALCLLKRLHYLEDVEGREVALHYCRTKDGRKIDFLLKVDETVYLIEVKTSDNNISKHFSYFEKYFDKPNCIQLVKNLDKEYSNQEGHQVCDLLNWLAKIDENIK